MIKAQNLVKRYLGDILAVDNVSFEVNPGDILGFLGPNGAGKSTTMKMVTGFLTPTAGTASIGGHDIRTNPIEAKKLLGYLPERGPLYEEMTVREFLKFVAEMRQLRGAKRREALDHVIAVCHLEGVIGQTIDTLSKGFRQRVGLAQAIIHNPPCLIMDEPTDGLDPNQKLEVRKLISSMAKEKAIILSTHILEEVEAICNRVIIINKGRLVVDETPSELLVRNRKHRAVEIVFSGPCSKFRNTIAKVEGVKDVEEKDGNIIAFSAKGEDVKPALWRKAVSEKWPIVSIENVHTRMDDVFHELTRKQAS